MNLVDIDKLQEHHKNGHYFTDVEGEKYEEIRRSIEQHGIRDPIKVMQKPEVDGTSKYIVISGHQRLRIARDIGLQKVPVQVIPDITEEDAEYLLIAENVERRGQAETDPIKKSRIANFLKEYWGVLEGKGGDRRSKDKTPLKSVSDISETLGESERNTKRIMKLNDLIPQLQTLVSDGKLGTTAGEQLAYLTEENQRALLNVLGKEIERTTVSKAKEYRSVQQESETSESYEEKLKELQEAKDRAEREAERARQSAQTAFEELEKERNKKPVVNKVIKEVDNTDYERIEELEKKIEQMSGEIEQAKVEKQAIQNKLERQQSKTREYNALKQRLEEKEEELASLNREQSKMKNRQMVYIHASNMVRDVGKATRKIRFIMNERGDVRGDKQVYNTLEAVIKTLKETIDEVERWMSVEVLGDQHKKEKGDYIDAEIIDMG